MRVLLSGDCAVFAGADAQSAAHSTVHGSHSCHGRGYGALVPTVTFVTGLAGIQEGAINVRAYMCVASGVGCSVQLWGNYGAGVAALGDWRIRELWSLVCLLPSVMSG